MLLIAMDLHNANLTFILVAIIYLFYLGTCIPPSPASGLREDNNKTVYIITNSQFKHDGNKIPAALQTHVGTVPRPSITCYQIYCSYGGRGRSVASFWLRKDLSYSDLLCGLPSDRIQSAVLFWSPQQDLSHRSEKGEKRLYRLMRNG